MSDASNDQGKTMKTESSSLSKSPRLSNKKEDKISKLQIILAIVLVIVISVSLSLALRVYEKKKNKSKS